MAGVRDELLLLLVVFFQGTDDPPGQNEGYEEQDNNGRPADDKDIVHQRPHAVFRHRIVDKRHKRISRFAADPIGQVVKPSCGFALCQQLPANRDQFILAVQPFRSIIYGEHSAILRKRDRVKSGQLEPRP